MILKKNGLLWAALIVGCTAFACGGGGEGDGDGDGDGGGEICDNGVDDDAENTQKWCEYDPKWSESDQK